MTTAAKKLRDLYRPDALASFEELNGVVGMADVQALEQKFLTPDQLHAKYGGAARSPA